MIVRQRWLRRSSSVESYGRLGGPALYDARDIAVEQVRDIASLQRHYNHIHKVCFIVRSISLPVSYGPEFIAET